MGSAGHTKQINAQLLRQTAPEHGEKKREGLAVHGTAKGRKEGTGARMAKFMVVIGYGVGVVHTRTQRYCKICGEVSLK